MIDAPQAISAILIIGFTMMIAWLIAPYLMRVFTRAPSRLDRVLNPIERLVYRLGGVDSTHTMGLKEYFVSGLMINVIQMAIAFMILSFQVSLHLNPLGFLGIVRD